MEPQQKEKEKVINLTGSDILIVDLRGNLIQDFPASKDSQKTIDVLNQARQKPQQKPTLLGCPVVENVFELAEDFPVEESGVFYIVTPRVKQLFPKRSDFVAPGTPATAFGIEGKGKFVNFTK